MNNLEEYEQIVIDVAFDGIRPEGVKFKSFYKDKSDAVNGMPAYIFYIPCNDDPQITYEYIFYIVAEDKTKMVIYEFPPKEIDVKEFYGTFKPSDTSNTIGGGL